MSAPSPIGVQVTKLRMLRTWTQEELAHRSGLSVDTIRKLEQGTRGMVRLHTLSRIARALDVEMAVTFDLPSMLPPVNNGGVLAIRRVLTSPDNLDGFADFADDGPVPSLTELAESIDEAWRVWQRGDYAVLAAMLPDLIAEARHATREMTGDDQVTGWGLLATGYEIAAGVTCMIGKEDLAWIAVERAMTAASRSDDELTRASAEHFAAWVYRRQGRYDECQRVATRAAAAHEPRLTTATPQYLSVWGGLLINASGAAARGARVDDAAELLSVARAAAVRLGHDRADRWSVFGPRLVSQTEVVNATEMGDMERAVRLAEGIPERGDLPPTWESRYLLGLAQAQAGRHLDTEALSTLTRARGITPEWIRYHRLARDIVLALVERAGRRRSDQLDALVGHLGLTP